MRVSTNGSGATQALARSGAVAPGEAVIEAAAPGAPDVALQSAVLQPALEALRAMPDIDHERVATLRDALAKGELPFDPSKLAGLIQRFHGGQ